jgi:hypothetical protein
MFFLGAKPPENWHLWRQSWRSTLQPNDGCVHRLLEGAAGEAEERAAGDEFRDWAEAEHLIVKFGE